MNPADDELAIINAQSARLRALCAALERDRAALPADAPSAAAAHVANMQAGAARMFKIVSAALDDQERFLLITHAWLRRWPKERAGG